MEKDYTLISIYASESTRADRKPFHEAVLKAVQDSGSRARCVVLRGIAGVDGSGRVATKKIEILSLDLPIKIEVLVPESAAAALMDSLVALAPEDVVMFSQRVTASAGACGQKR